MDTINFYSTTGQYGCFSNFSKHPVALGGTIWPTSEHYFQAMKFAGTKDVQDVFNAPTPTLAASIGRDKTRPLRSDWEQVKDDVMRKVVLAKFLQHDNIREILVGTGDAILVEHTSFDKYWGDGGDGSGKNMLGKILMEVREKLKLHPPLPPLGFSTDLTVLDVHDGDTITVRFERVFNVRLNNVRKAELDTEEGKALQKQLKDKLFKDSNTPRVRAFIPSHDPLRLMDFNSFERIVADIYFQGEKLE